MSAFRRLLVFTVFVGAWISHAFALTPTIPVSNEYVLRTWEIDEGLPSNHISSIAQTPDGYLWLATSSGLVRFDGLHFTPFPKDAESGIEFNRVYSLFTSREGDLWLGLERGKVARKRGGHFEFVVSTAVPRSPAFVRSFAQDSLGAVWFAGDIPNVLRWSRGNICSYSSDQGINPGMMASVQAATDGTIWLATTEACGFFDGTKFRAADSGRGGEVRVTSSNDGGMWATQGSWLWRYQADGSRKAVVYLGQRDVNTLSEDSSGALWVGTKSAGLFRFYQGRLEQVPTSQTNITFILEDREKNLWVGTDGGGLNRIRRRCFLLYTTKDGLSNDNITSLCEDTDGKMWVVGGDTLVARAMDSANKKFAKISYKLVSGIMNIFPDPNGGVWFGTAEAQLKYWKDGIILKQEIPSSTSLLMDRQKNLWVGTIDGHLFCLKNEDKAKIIVDEGLDQARALAEDSSGALWVGGEDGLVFRRQKNQFLPVPFPDPQPGRPIRFIVADQSNTVWIGAHEGGLYRWREGKMTRLPDHEGMETDDLRSLLIEPNGNFWFGTGRGLYRVARTEIEGVIEGRQSKIRSMRFGRDDGLPNLDFSYGFRNSAIRTHDGYLWFATSRGALEINPENLPRPADASSALIEGIEADGVNQASPGSGTLQFPKKPTSLQIYYTLPQLTDPGQIRFRYRLLGSDNEQWISADTRRSVNFSSLRSGDYQFEVQGADAGGSWTSRPAVLRFNIKAAWWESKFYRISLFIVVGLILAWFARLIEMHRIRRRILNLEQNHALELERSRLARDLHDQVGANLTQIAYLAELATNSGMLSQLAGCARQAIEALDGVVWAVDPVKDTLRSLLEYLVRYGEDFIKSANLRFRIDLPADVPTRRLPPEFRHHVLLVVKEALNNSVKYGKASEIKLGGAFSSEFLTIFVTDNGCGFDMSGKLTEGHGLNNIRTRVAALKGECRIDSTPGAGTTIMVKVPWPVSSL